MGLRELVACMDSGHNRRMLRFSPKPNLAHLIPWVEWEEAAFQRARAENKPVMLWLGAFWCGYCQRMDEETFSDRENLALLSAYFVPLRVEYAKRPDIDARYNLNGWPTVAFLAPQGQLLAAVNYLPVEEFKNLLIDVHLAYQERQNEFAVAVEREPEPTPAGALPGIDAQVITSALDALTAAIMAQADRVNGGFGHGQKFIQADGYEFLLARYESTKDVKYLDQVRLTLDRMRAGPIHDNEEGGYFRTTTGADWTRPHREKLLIEQAGLVRNCLHVYKITAENIYAEMAEEIIAYLNKKLLDPATGAFFGCEDFLRTFAEDQQPTDEFFTVIDECIYTDANAQAISAYLDGAAILGKPDYRAIALRALDFLWSRCRGKDGGMFHYFDGAPQLQGLLNDQVQMGLALLSAHAATQEKKYLDGARELAEFVLARLTNPAGGYFDICEMSPAHSKLRLTLIEHNGNLSCFLMSLADIGGDGRYRGAARSAFMPFVANCAGHGIHAANLGRALSDFLART